MKGRNDRKREREQTPDSDDPKAAKLFGQLIGASALDGCARDGLLEPDDGYLVAELASKGVSTAKGGFLEASDDLMIAIEIDEMQGGAVEAGVDSSMRIGADEDVYSFESIDEKGGSSEAVSDSVVANESIDEKDNLLDVAGDSMVAMESNEEKDGPLVLAIQGVERKDGLLKDLDDSGIITKDNGEMDGSLEPGKGDIVIAIQKNEKKDNQLEASTCDSNVAIDSVEKKDGSLDANTGVSVAAIHIGEKTDWSLEATTSNSIVVIEGKEKGLEVKGCDGPADAGSKKASISRTSNYHGVTRHRWTRKYEAHLWDGTINIETRRRKGKQVYLGGYDSEEKAARAYDLAALKYWGLSPGTKLNYPVSDYEKELEEMKNMSQDEWVQSLRRKSSCFARGVSAYRGVTRRRKDGKWQARLGSVAGTRAMFLGAFETEEEAAIAYDIAAIELRGLNAITNFDISNYKR